MDNEQIISLLEEKLEQWQHKQRYIYIGIVVVVLIVMLFSVLRPTLKQYEERTRVLRQFKDVLKEQEKKALNKENIEKEIKRLKALLKEKEQSFFSLDEIKEFSLNTLPQLAEGMGNKVESVVYKKQSKRNNIFVYPIFLSFKGDFDSMFHFFYEIENYQKVIKIKDFTVTRKQVDPVEISVQMTVEAYAK